MKKIKLSIASQAIFQIAILSVAIFAFSFLLYSSFTVVSAQQADYCCEKTDKTKYGKVVWCMNAPEENCVTSFDPLINRTLRKTPTSCDATSFCRQGCCYESQEGLCMENTPQRVCDNEGGTWVDSPECDIPQCNLGCCVLDNQAAFVTLTRCKRLSGFYGLETDFRTNVDSEVECIAITQLKDRGACVYEEEYTKTCKFTTREQCEKIRSTGNMTEPEFYKNYLCSADELATNCGPTTETTCVDGKNEVYFVDSCGNPANIYDADKTYEKDNSYWKEIKDKSESCGVGSANENSATCGNCDYYLGSLCKKAERGSALRYGNYICEDLNCYDTSDGKDFHRHGESWCSYDGNIEEGRDAVGSRHYRHICVAGEELVEACADFRQEVCIEGEIEIAGGEKPFQESACRVNRWQNCIKEDEKEDCENIDKRDCFWVEGVSFIGTTEGNTGESGGVAGLVEGGDGACVPNTPPGLKFWEEGETEGICSVASAQCVVTYEKGVLGSKKCVDNCECLEDSWAQKMNQVCAAIGDCGGYVNWQNKFTGDGYEWKVGNSKKKLSQSIINSIKSQAGITGRVVAIGKSTGVNALVVALAKGANWLIGGSLVSGQGDPWRVRYLIDPQTGETVEIIEASTPPTQTVTAPQVAPGTFVSTVTKESVEKYILTSEGKRYLVTGGEMAVGKDVSVINPVTAEKGTLKNLNDAILSTKTTATAIESKFGVMSVELVDGTKTTVLEALKNPDYYKDTNLLKALNADSITTNSAGDILINQPKGAGMTLEGGLDGKLVVQEKGTSFLSKLFGMSKGTFMDAALTGVQYAAIMYGVGQLIGSLAGLDKKQTSAVSWGLATGTFTYQFLGTLKEGAVYDFLKGKLGMIQHQLAWGIGVGIVVGVLLYKKESKEIVTFTCQPWQAPTGSRGGNDCEKCNQGDKDCSEYRCKSLGQACELLNAGTEDEKCDWVNPRDTTSPVISLWEEVLTKGYEYEPDTAIRPPARGVKILKTVGDGCVKAFTPLEFGITTDEPAQCRIDYNHTLKFDNMAFYFGESNLFLYNHSQKMSLPGPSAINAAAPELQHDGTYTLYVRCQDANENANVDEFAIRFCVEKGPDTTPPEIKGTNIANNMPVKFNQSNVDLEVYINEPAECKWSREDRSYSNMENEMTCSENVWEMNNNLVYTCETDLTEIKDRQDNVFYFRCKDQPYPNVNESDRNVMQESYKFTLVGTRTLNIIDVEPNGTIKGSTDVISIWLEVETANGYRNGEAICYYGESGEEADWLEFYETGTELHKQRLALTADNYTYYIKCVDLGGNRDDNYTEFRVEKDEEAPFVARVYEENELLKIITTEDSDCRYDNRNCIFDFEDGIDMPYANQTEHVVKWETDKTYYIKCADKYGNQPLSGKCSITVRPYDTVEQKAED